MIDAGIIEPIEELEWIIPMVIQDKKTIGEVKIYVNFRKLNDVCLHDPFPTPFTDEVLENVCGQEMYSYTNGFLGYHQVRIALADRHKATFIQTSCKLQANITYFFNMQTYVV